MPRARAFLLATGILLACLGLAWPWLGIERTVPLALDKAVREHGFAFRPASMPPEVRHLASDDQGHPARSRLRLLEDGKALGPGNSLHADVRSRGGGRFSHWQQGLLFTASDNSDPRTNGRAYALAYDEPLPPAAGWLCLLVASILLVGADRAGRVRRLPRWGPRIGRAWDSWGSASLRVASGYGTHAALFAALAVCAVAFGMERSAWILVTQPFEATHAANSLLGFSWVMDDTVVHRDNLSSFLQVAFLSGVDVIPDARFRHPLFAFLAMVLAPVLGVAGAMIALNVAAWAGAIWLTHRFTLRLMGDDAAAKWAALLAVTGVGFGVHVLDLSGHLLASTLYMAGVVIVLESEAWARRVPLRTHLAIGAFLVIACLQQGTGVALVAGYLLVSLRHNRAWHVLAVSLLALAAQPLWMAILGEAIHHRRSAELSGLIGAGPLRQALEEWGAVFALPPGDIAGKIASYLASFATFEMPLVVVAGLAGLAISFTGGREARARAGFALPFLILPFALALGLAPTTTERGPLVYGASLFFFAGAGIAVASLVRRREALAAPVAALLVVVSLAWSTAHYGNVLGPAKAYVSGPGATQHLFVPGAWEVESLTNSDPTPRFLGGTHGLSEAGLVRAATPAGPEEKDARYALIATALFVLVAVLLLAAMVPVGWPSAVALGVSLSIIVTTAGQATYTRQPIASVERVYRIEVGRSLTVVISLGTDFRKRLLTGMDRGAIVMLFPAFYNGEAFPEVTIDGHVVKVTGRADRGNWGLATSDLRAALKSSPGVLRVTFRGGDDVWLGGWQSRSRPGRTLSSGGRAIEPAAVVPAVEIRLLRDYHTRAPLLIGF